MRPSDVVRDSSISAAPSVGMTAYTIIDDDEKVELLIFILLRRFLHTAAGCLGRNDNVSMMVFLR